jgi:2-oxoisovalerate dehydrogenase E1 component
LILHTYRFSAHSKGDDLRLPEELDRIHTFDPLKLHGPRLSAEERTRAEAEVMAIVEDAFIRAEADTFPSLNLSD